MHRRLAKKTLIPLSKIFRFSRLKKLAKNKVYVLTYHSLFGADDEQETYRTAEEFENDLKFISRHFKVIDSVELSKILKHDVPIRRDAIVITIDDGLRVNYEMHVPLLKKYGLTATFFINSGFVDNYDLHFERKAKLILDRVDDSQFELIGSYLHDHKLFVKDVIHSIKSIPYHSRGHLDALANLIQLDFNVHLTLVKPYLSSDEIKSILSDGFRIGAHSIDHPRYEELSLEEQLYQTIGSITDITRRFSLPYRLFSFPYGDFGITNEFYKKVEPHVDIVFGTRGFLNDPISFSVQRSEVESTELPIEAALNYRLLTSGLFKLLGREIKRD